MLTVNSNISGLIAQNNLARSSSRLSTSLERLSTGMKINRAVDDPAGLVISEYQRAQLAGLDRAITNIDRATSFAQTADGGLAEINGLLTELRGLAIDSANQGSLDGTALAANQAQVQNLLTSIDRIANTTKFGNQTVLDGSRGLQGFVDNPATKFLQAGDPNVLKINGATAASSVYTVTVTTQAAKTKLDAVQMSAATINGDENLLINGVVVALTNGMTGSQIIERINQYAGQTGFTASNIGLSGANPRVHLEANDYGNKALTVYSDRPNGVVGNDTSGFGAANVVMPGADVDGTIARVIGGTTTGNTAATGKGSVLTGEFGHDGSLLSVDMGNLAVGSTPVSLIVSDQSSRFQVGAFGDDQATLALSRSASDGLGIGAGTIFGNLSKIDVRRADYAADAQLLIDRAVVEISSMRGTIGAFQAQTLAKTQNNLKSQFENMSSAESTLRDTDFAKEITKFTNEQIRQQASTTVLGLANQNAQQVLALLSGK